MSVKNHPPHPIQHPKITCIQYGRHLEREDSLGEMDMERTENGVILAKIRHPHHLYPGMCLQQVQGQEQLPSRLGDINLPGELLLQQVPGEATKIFHVVMIVILSS